MKVKMIIFLLLVTFNITGSLNGCCKSMDSSKLQDNISSNDNNNKDSNDNKSKDSNEASVFRKEEANENSTNISKGYEIIDKTYKKNNVKINYPQITKLSDSTKLNLINKDLEEEALNLLDMYITDDPDMKELTMDVNYQVKLNDDKYISVVYMGYSNLKGVAYPLSVFYTTNIDIEKGKSIRLFEYANVNDILNKLQNSNNVKVISEDEELKKEQKNVLLNIDVRELHTILEGADFDRVNGKVVSPREGAYSYMDDDDNIIISLNMNHAIGDHGEFLVKK